jgi:putative ABC transport system permease protein
VPQPGQPQIGLPVTAASAGGLATIGAAVSAGRLYDAGMDHRGAQVALLDPGVLLGVIVPPGAAATVAGRFGVDIGRQIMVRTVPGAAQLIGRQGPYAIDPLNPHAIAAAAPEDPSALRQSVSADFRVAG